MNDWNPREYLRFNQERLRPSIDLVQPIRELSFGVIVDAGCGPGNSTQVVRATWPESRVTGIDSSEEMIDRARADYPDGDWRLGDVADMSSLGPADLIFSNAVIQWVPDHAALMRHFADCLSSRGVLAVQVPLFFQMPLAAVIHDVATRSEWAQAVDGARELLTIHSAGGYYDILTSLFQRVDIWETHYFHVMPSHRAIVDMIRSTGLRPYLERLDPDQAARFEGEVLRGAEQVYPVQTDGAVLFPFKRLFFIGYKTNEK